MDRYLIEVEHEAEKGACIRAVKAFLNTGSHFLMNADWGCYDGVHKAWIVIELESREEAFNIVPPGFRSQTSVVKLNNFSVEHISDMERHHQGIA